MRLGLQQHLAFTRQKLGEGWVSGKAGAHCEGIHKKADQVLGLGPTPVSHRCSDDNVFLSAVPRQYDVETHKQRSEQSRPLALVEFSELLCQ